ncbi:AraC family transcriptional regulator [Niastella vici]|uniref:AraC family transcriptional regulator n=1 Tax=Niastella vici TaxID=1703345 RepID=A0A1V9FZS0_9BACT|nr:helix-turn-helix transcriptional regulator [Niastella vici]OQP63814.1 AraC family transcriptional regulator [Niastella vici]
MEKEKNIPLKLNSISEMHKVLGFPKPLHPLISLVNYADIKIPYEEWPKSISPNFYKISYKKSLTGKIKYGQGFYDFDEGGLSFISPNQVISCADDEQDYSGCTLLIHPDFIRGYTLDHKIKTYGFFSYSANEALFLSDKEKQIIISVFENIKEELSNPIDDVSQELVISHIEVLLNYSNRFYKRQFITRKAASHDLLIKFEQLLNVYFEQEEGLQKGLPTVEYLAGQLNFSPRYLSDMLRSLTGQNAQQHIHEKLIEKAKEYLTAGNLTVAEVAYLLGFEHPQSFNKLFRKKTNLTPIAFKRSFN